MPRSEIAGRVDEFRCIIDLTVGISSAREGALSRNDMAVPLRVPVRAVIDTGSSVTAIDPGVMASLQIEPIGEVYILTPSTGTTPHRCPQYHVSLAIPGHEAEFRFPDTLVIESRFTEREGLQALLGMDLLAHCVFTCDGPGGTFSLRY